MRPQRLHLSQKQSRWLPPAQLRDGAVIRHPVEEVEAQVPTQGDVGLDTPLDLPLRRDAVQEPHLQVLHDDHRVDGRTAVFFCCKAGLLRDFVNSAILYRLFRSNPVNK